MTAPIAASGEALNLKKNRLKFVSMRPSMKGVG
jgi:hypothetical protein